MAQKTVVLLEDDLDGGVATETVTFSLDGVSYEMDLSEQNATALRGLFGPYAEAGRRLGGRAAAAPSTRTRSGGPTKVDPTQLAAIRAWARGRGLEINDRGRIPGRIIEQYNAEATAKLAPAAPAPAAEPAAQTARGRKAAKIAADLQFSERP